MGESVCLYTHIHMYCMYVCHDVLRFYTLVLISGTLFYMSLLVLPDYRCRETPSCGIVFRGRIVFFPWFFLVVVVHVLVKRDNAPESRRQPCQFHEQIRLLTKSAQ